MLPKTLRIFVCTTPQDMRRSFDALALCTRRLLGEDPQSGALFIFVGKSARRMKILWWDRNGYCLLYKRLHRAVFKLPDPDTPGASKLSIDSTQLALLLQGISVPPVAPQLH
jgi:transposase